MKPAPASVPTQTWVEVSYLVATGGSGLTRMALETLPAWLSDPDNPGRMVIRIRPA